MQGYIKLHRKFFENPFWCEARIFSKGEAWLDLIQVARIEPSNAIVNGKVIELRRGELCASIRYLAKRWSWGEQKVRTYLQNLKNLQMITHRQHSGETVIMLVNYRVYNDGKHSDDDENNTAITQRQHTDNTPITQSIRKKERKKESVSADEPRPIKNNFDKNKSEFIDLLKPFVAVYGKDMVNNFFKYWTEPNKSKTKMKFQLEETWDLSRRLERWAANDEKFRPKQKVEEQQHTTLRQL